MFLFCSGHKKKRLKNSEMESLKRCVGLETVVSKLYFYKYTNITKFFTDSKITKSDKNATNIIKKIKKLKTKLK